MSLAVNMRDVSDLVDDNFKNRKSYQGWLNIRTLTYIAERTGASKD